MTVIDYLEISKEEDRPPKQIWLDDELLNEHFAAVSARYSEQSEGLEQVPMDQNELTARFKKGAPTT